MPSSLLHKILLKSRSCPSLPIPLPFPSPPLGTLPLSPGPSSPPPIHLKPTKGHPWTPPRLRIFILCIDLVVHETWESRQPTGTGCKLRLAEEVICTSFPSLFPSRVATRSTVLAVNLWRRSTTDPEFDSQMNWMIQCHPRASSRPGSE